MATYEIAQNDWSTFLDTFSKEHEGLAASVLVLGPDVGAQEAAEGLPFAGICAEWKGSEKDSVTILLGTEPGDHAEHHIPAATHVWVKEDGESSHDVIEIESSDGYRTILQLRIAPELSG